MIFVYEGRKVVIMYIFIIVKILGEKMNEIKILNREKNVVD